MKNIIKAFGIIALVAIIGFSMTACGGDDGGGGGDETVLLKMTFEESYDWNKPGNEDWGRWIYEYKDTSKPFDLSSMYAQNKAYRFTYSFVSDIDIDVFSAQFNEHDYDISVAWIPTAEWAQIKTDIKKNTKYSGSVLFIPNASAAGTQSAKTYLQFQVRNRNVATPATLSFYKFSFEIVDKDSGGTDGNEGEFDNLDGLKDWLNGKGNNTKDNPYKIKIKFGNLSGLLDFLKGLSGKYVSLDFTGSGLTSIPVNAFYDASTNTGCATLVGITLPNSVASIGANAFRGCSSLTSITMPSGLTSIGESAFQDCTSLTSITIPNGVTYILFATFSNCTSLTSVTFNGTISSDNLNSTAFGGSGTIYYIGDLRAKYLAGGAGTYTRPSGGTTWTKQSSSGSSWTVATVSGIGTTPLWSIAYGNGKYVVVGNEGKAAYSSDCITWQAISDMKMPSSGTIPVPIYGITWGSDKFIAVGQSGKMAYSSDGITWQPVSNSNFTYQGNAAHIQDVAWGNNKFVAVGNYGRMTYSSDGITWQAVGDSKFDTTDIQGVAWCNNKFIAVGKNGKMAYSSDGVTWQAVTNSTFDTTKNVRNVAYGNNKYVAVGDSGQIAYSSDGITWQAVSNSPFSSGLRGVAWGDNKFVLVGIYGAVATSSDGVTWAVVTDSNVSGYSSDFSNGIVWGNSKFVVIGDNSKVAYWNGN